MYTLYGIWMDHSHAFIVKTNKLGEDMQITELKSGVPPKHHGGSTGDEHLTLTDQHSHEETRKNELHKFCQEIIEQIKDTDEFVVFGPGIAKNHLKNEVEKIKALSPKLKGMETTDKMLRESQLKETVKQLLNLPRE